MIDQTFSNEEINSLCFDLGIDYEHLRGQTKLGKIEDLLMYLIRRKRLAELVDVCRQQRPDTLWSDPPPTEELLRDIQVADDILRPQLILSLFNVEERKRIYEDEIVIVQRSGFRQQYRFGLALQNLANGSKPAEKIDILIEFHWRDNRNSIFTTPQFGFVNQPDGWSVRMPNLVNEQSATLVLTGTEQHRCAYGIPLEWPDFQVIVGEKLDGHFLLTFVVTSTTPHTSNRGELRIMMD